MGKTLPGRRAPAWKADKRAGILLQLAASFCSASQIERHRLSTGLSWVHVQRVKMWHIYGAFPWLSRKSLLQHRGARELLNA